MTRQRAHYDDNRALAAGRIFHAPPGLRKPFMREQIVNAGMRWVLTRQANEDCRIYTGRPHGHTPERDRDTIDGGGLDRLLGRAKLVILTISFKAGPWGGISHQSEEMETVEIWERVNTNTIAIAVGLRPQALSRALVCPAPFTSWFPTPTRACEFATGIASRSPTTT